MEGDALIPSTPPPASAEEEGVRKSARPRRPRVVPPVTDNKSVKGTKRRKSVVGPALAKKIRKESLVAAPADQPPEAEDFSEIIIPTPVLREPKKKKKFVPADVPPIPCMEFYLKLQRKARKSSIKPPPIPAQETADLPPVEAAPWSAEKEGEKETESLVEEVSSVMEKTPGEKKSKKQQQIDVFMKSQPSVLRFFAAKETSPSSPEEVICSPETPPPMATTDNQFKASYSVEVPHFQGYLAIWKKKKEGKRDSKKLRIFFLRSAVRGDPVKILNRSELPVKRGSVYVGDNPGTRIRLTQPRPIYVAIHDRERPPVKFILTHRSTSVVPRKPLAADALIDYDKDSDEEYEEEKEGEDLNSNAENILDEEEGDVESEADSFFVSDGHFSEDDALSDDEAVVARRQRQEMSLDSEGKATLQLIAFSPSDLLQISSKNLLDSASDPSHAKWLALLESEAVISVIDPLNYFNTEPEDEKIKKRKESAKPVIDWAAVRPELARFIHGKTANIDSLCSEFKILQPEIISSNALKTEIRTIGMWTKKPELNSRVAWYVKPELFEQLGVTELEMAALIPPPPAPVSKEKLLKDQQVLNFEAVIADREYIHN